MFAKANRSLEDSLRPTVKTRLGLAYVRSRRCLCLALAAVEVNEKHGDRKIIELLLIGCSVADVLLAVLGLHCYFGKCKRCAVPQYVSCDSCGRWVPLTPLAVLRWRSRWITA